MQSNNLSIPGSGALIAMMISAKLRGFTGPPAGRATEIRALVEGRARTERLSAIHAEYMRRSGRSKR